MILPTATLKITGAAILLFAAGVLTGSFGTSAFHSQSRPRNPRPPSPASLHSPSTPVASGAGLSGGSSTNRRSERAAVRPPGWQRFEALKRLEDQIQLAPDQKERIRTLVRESEQRIRADWEPVVPRIQTEIRDLRRRIAAELNPEQRERFDQLLERRDSTPSTKGSRRTNTVPASVR